MWTVGGSHVDCLAVHMWVVECWWVTCGLLAVGDILLRNQVGGVHVDCLPCPGCLSWGPKALASSIQGVRTGDGIRGTFQIHLSIKNGNVSWKEVIPGMRMCAWK